MQTTSIAPSFSAGLPVEIEAIDRELKKLWQEGGEVMTRASLINLAVYSEAPDSLARNTQIVAQITEDHACRALVIAADCAAAEESVQAWISAHCHVSRAGSKQICSEQLSFLLEGESTRLLPNIVFSHLDSDLPFYLWWQDELRPPLDQLLWTWVDRLIFDSQKWGDPRGQLQLLEQVQEEANARVVLCDLNWTRLVHMRLALAQFFDHPASHAAFGNVHQVEIDFAAGYRSTALLLAGWFAAQLGWKAADTGEPLHFRNRSGDTLKVNLRVIAGTPISRCSLFAGEIEFRVVHPAEGDLLVVSKHIDGTERAHQLMPAGSNEPVALMSEELMRGGPHRIYLRAIEAVRAWL